MLGSAQPGHSPALLVSNISHFKEFRLVWLTLVYLHGGISVIAWEEYIVSSLFSAKSIGRNGNYMAME
jgi:hypothetical protein